MNQPRIPLRYRLSVRQSVPILAGLVGVLSLLLVMGYLHARQQFVETARLQVSQLVGSIARQDAYSRRWIERGMPPLLGLAAAIPGIPPQQRQEVDRRVMSIISDERGKQTVENSLLDSDGTLWQRDYDSRGVIESAEFPKNEGEQPPERTPDYAAAFKSAHWHKPVVTPDRTITLRYSAPILSPRAAEQPNVLGVCTVSLDMPWFAERVRSFSSFENCLVFFMTMDGQWTLPVDADTQLDSLRQQMLAHTSGEYRVSYNRQSWLAVFMPLTDDSLHMGVLIPYDNLFGSLNRLTWLLAICGIVVLVLAAWSLHRTSAHLLSSLPQLRDLVGRLARGELEAIPDSTAALPPPPFPDEAQRLKMMTEKLRQDMHQRVHDLTLIGRTRERLFGELAFARSVQEKLRPLPLSPTEKLEVAAFVHTADEVCGDMYDYFFQSPRHLCCVMGNVTEKGVPAALLMGRIGPLLRELLLSGLSPGKALENINRMLLPATPQAGAPTMVSTLAGVLDLDTGIFRWASAGQLPPFHCRADSVEHLEWTGNTALAIRAEEVYLEQETRLAPGESLLFAGQRLLSLSSEDEGLDTKENLCRFMQNRREPLSELLTMLYADIRLTLGRDPQDDLTFFAVRWRGVPAEQSDADNDLYFLHAAQE